MADVSPWPERIDPENTEPGIVAHHLAKYRFARGFVRDLVVDAGCGVGYGAADLAAAGGSVIGVEIDEGAVSLASSRYGSNKVRFVRGDVERLPLRGSAAGAITCFEAIEHLRDPRGHLSEVARVLGPDGVYLVSTPVPGAHPHAAENPFHLHEWGPREFRELLRSRFDDVTLMGQFRVQTRSHRAAQRADVLGLRRSRLLRPIAKMTSRSLFRTAPVEEASLKDFEVRELAPGASEYVAVCRGPVA
jgi:SAM-dependent methyltransferase